MHICIEKLTEYYNFAMQPYDCFCCFQEYVSYEDPDPSDKQASDKNTGLLRPHSMVPKGSVHAKVHGHAAYQSESLQCLLESLDDLWRVAWVYWKLPI